MEERAWLARSRGGFSTPCGGGRNTQLGFSLRGPDLEVLSALAAKFMDRMRQTPGLVDIDSSAAVRKPEVRVKIDRARAADLGVRAGEIAAALRTMVGGEPVSKVRGGAGQDDLGLRPVPDVSRGVGE